MNKREKGIKSREKECIIVSKPILSYPEIPDENYLNNAGGKGEYIYAAFSAQVVYQYCKSASGCPYRFGYQHKQLADRHCRSTRTGPVEFFSETTAYFSDLTGKYPHLGTFHADNQRLHVLPGGTARTRLCNCRILECFYGCTRFQHNKFSVKPVDTVQLDNQTTNFVCPPEMKVV